MLQRAEVLKDRFFRGQLVGTVEGGLERFPFVMAQFCLKLAHHYDSHSAMDREGPAQVSVPSEEWLAAVSEPGVNVWSTMRKQPPPQLHLPALAAASRRAAATRLNSAAMAGASTAAAERRPARQ